MSMSVSPTAPLPQGRREMSIRIKLAIAFGFVFMLLFAGAFLWFYNFAIGVAKTQIQTNLNNALVNTAEGISGNTVVSLFNEAEPTLYDDRGDDDPENDVYLTDDPRYWEIAQWLWTVHQIDARAFPYVYVKSDDPDDPAGFYYVVDGLSLAEPLPEWMVDFKEHEESDQGWVFRGMEGTITYLDEPYEWRDIWWVSGYTPIYDGSGNIVAGLGIDYEASYLIQVERNIQAIAIPAFVAIFVIMFGLVFLTSRFVSQPIVNLAKLAEAVGEGNYELDFKRVASQRFPDEIATLADTLEQMSQKVERREIKLKQEVEELRIQIDHSRRDEQVKEIVEDEFFLQLQQRATGMRSRRERKPETPPAETTDTETAATNKDTST
jgi:hypothetical protein